MLIEIHVMQNHSPANLNRDDLGAPKTCYFGGVLRSRISSQCIKRSIRTSDEFEKLLGGIRTRRLPKYLADKIKDKDVIPIATAIVQKCGLLHEGKGDKKEKKDVIVFLSKSAADQMVQLLRDAPATPSVRDIERLAGQFAKLIAEDHYAPDMALSGRMLEPAKPPKKGSASKTSEAGEDEENGEEDDKKKGVWKGLNLTIEAALQVAHAISTHEARPEVDYFIAADDVKDVDAGGAHIGEALFASACFYKYFSIHWETLLENLKGFPGNQEYLAAHTVGAFLRGAALVTPTGKQNSFAAHNLPDGILVEIREKRTPISYANAFAKPAARGRRDLVSESIAQLGQYVLDMDTGYGKSDRRFWFSPNLRHSLSAQVPDEKDPKKKKEVALTDQCFRSLDDLIPAVIARIGNGYDWSAVQKVTINPEAGA